MKTCLMNSIWLTRAFYLLQPDKDASQTFSEAQRGFRTGYYMNLKIVRPKAQKLRNCFLNKICYILHRLDVHS